MLWGALTREPGPIPEYHWARRSRRAGCCSHPPSLWIQSHPMLTDRSDSSPDQGAEGGADGSPAHE